MRGIVEVEGEEMAVSPPVEKRSVRVPKVSEVGEWPGTKGWGRTAFRFEKYVGPGEGDRAALASIGCPSCATAWEASSSCTARDWRGDSGRFSKRWPSTTTSSACSSGGSVLGTYCEARVRSETQRRTSSVRRERSREEW